MKKRLTSNRKATIDIINLIQREFSLLNEKGDEGKMIDSLSRMEAKVKVRVVLLNEGKTRISSPVPEANSPDYWRASLIIIKHAKLTFLEDRESFSLFLHKLKAHITESEGHKKVKEDLPLPKTHIIESEDHEEVKKDKPLPITSNVMKGTKISILGLDQAGKTTILQRLITGRFIPNPVQTIGVSSETIQINNVKFTAWDLGGQLQFRRALWKMYTKNTAGLVFVIDLVDKRRFSEALSSLKRIMKMPHLKDIPLALFLNKGDLLENFPDQNLPHVLEIDELDGRETEVFQTSAKTGEGIIEGIYWLSNAIIAKE